MTTSRSTVAVAFGVPITFAWGDAVPLAEVDVFVGVAFGSGVTAKLDSVVVGGVDISGPPTFGGCSGLVVLVD